METLKSTYNRKSANGTPYTINVYSAPCGYTWRICAMDGTEVATQNREREQLRTAHIAYTEAMNTLRAFITFRDEPTDAQQ